EWAPGLEGSLAWNDPTLNIKWEIAGEPVLSEKDKQNPTLKELFPDRF
ncbi:MAG: dTDP-4-dehydrorhamnose 3,5-epimerase family protein, partial [Candidatus Levybacteria bacterium]|nr:dTDP-4-dehydrorhamnose 3,5-epimerase family protein [Candidatus Levybacteria bacterium]